MDLRHPQIRRWSPTPPGCSPGDRPPAGSCSSSWTARRGGRCRRSRGWSRPGRGRGRRRRETRDRRSVRVAHSRLMIPDRSARRGTTLVRSIHSAGRVVIPAHRAQSVDRRRPGGARGVRVGGAARGGVPQLEAKLGRDTDRELHQASGPLTFFSIGRCHPCACTATVTSGPTDFAQIRWISASAASNVASSGERRSTCSSQRSGTTFVRVPPRATPDVHGDAGPPAVERLQRDDLVGGLDQRACAPSPVPRPRARRAP